MPKNETLEIQNLLLELGNKLGFIPKIEERIHTNDTYAPIYDAVWYVDMEKYVDFSSLEPLFMNSPELLEQMKKLPFAGFEIEGSTTTSKNQIGNFANLHAGRFLFNFEIVNNAQAGNENDTYRRGLKVYHYCNHIFSECNDSFMDKSQLYESIENLPENINSNVVIGSCNFSDRGTYGGEKAESIKMFSEILPMLRNSGLSIVQNKEPSICKLQYYAMKQAFSESIGETGKHYISQNYYEDPVSCNVKKSAKTKDSLYVPKMDIEAGFTMPESFFKWLGALGKAMKNDAVHYPLIFGITNKVIKEYFISLIAVEIENSINKHLNGGICNMSHFAHTGILVTNQSAKGHIEFLKRELGIRNVTYYQV